MSGSQQPPQSAVQANAANGAGWQRPVSRVPGIVLLIVIGLAASTALVFGWQYMRGVREARRAEKERQVMAQPTQYQPRPTAPEAPSRGLIGQARDALLGQRSPAEALPTPRVGSVYSAPARRISAPARPVREGVREASEGREAPGANFVGMAVQQAEVYPGNPDYMVLPGAKMACLTVEPIRGIEGHNFTARIIEDVRGRTGTQIAIPRDSTVYGKITSGPDDETGDVRFAAILEHIQWPTPPGKPIIGIRLNSQIAEPMGDIGGKGNVRTHFWRRLGATAAFAAVDALTGFAAAEAAGLGSGEGGTVYNFGPVLRRGSSGIAREEYQRQARRRADFDRPPGQPCMVFVNTPLDASKAAAAWRNGR